MKYNSIAAISTTYSSITWTPVGSGGALNRNVSDGTMRYAYSGTGQLVVFGAYNDTSYATIGNGILTISPQKPNSFAIKFSKL